jgi:hypothetical protein
MPVVRLLGLPDFAPAPLIRKPDPNMADLNRPSEAALHRAGETRQLGDLGQMRRIPHPGLALSHLATGDDAAHPNSLLMLARAAEATSSIRSIMRVATTSFGVTAVMAFGGDLS